MDKAKLWESLCKPCSVTIERLADSIINQSRRRTTPRQHPYPSRKRSGDNEIYSCRLLRPKRKLQFSSDGITSLAYMLNDTTDDDPEERLFDTKSIYSDTNDEQSCTSSDVPRLTPKIDDEDAISPVWKFKRKTRKLSETSEESEKSVNQQSIKQALSNLKAREEERRVDEEVRNINREAERRINEEIENSNREATRKINKEVVNVNREVDRRINEEIENSNREATRKINKEVVNVNREAERRINEEIENSNREATRKINKEVGNVNREAEQNTKINERTKFNFRLKKEIKIKLNRVEETESDDPLVLTWKLRNGFINHEELEKHLEVFLNEKPDESLDQRNMEFSFNKDFSGVLHAVDGNEETEEIESSVVGSSVDEGKHKTIDDDTSETSSKIESQELPNANSQSSVLPSTKSPKARKSNKKNHRWYTYRKKSKPKEKLPKLVPKTSILECRMCGMKFSNKEELATHLYSHTSSDLQETFAQAKQQQIEESKKNKDSNSGGASNNDLDDFIVLENRVAEVSTTEVANSADADSEILSSDTSINRRVSIDSDVIANVCACHNNDNSPNEFSVQIEMVLFCATCNILFRRSECFETHYRVSRKCNENRGIGRTPKLFCSTCRVILNTLSSMRRHLEEHANINFHGTVTFVCNICRVVFFGVGTVFCTHWFAHEKDPTFVGSKHGFPRLCISNNGVKPAGAAPSEEYLFVAEYVCRSCKQQFSSESELSKHSEIECKKQLESKANKTIPAKSVPSNTTSKVVAPPTPRYVPVPSPRIIQPPTPRYVPPPSPRVAPPPTSEYGPLPRVVLVPSTRAGAAPTPTIVTSGNARIIAVPSPKIIAPSTPKVVASTPNVVPPSPKVVPPRPKVVYPPSPKLVVPSSPMVVEPPSETIVAPPKPKEPSPPPPPAPSSPLAPVEIPMDVNWITNQKSSYFFKLISQWDCSFCQQKYNTWDDFEQHCQSHLQDRGYPGFYCTPQNSRAAYICNICRKLYNTFPDLMKHWSSHDIIQFICTNCRIKFTTLIEFLHHMKRGCWRVKPECRIQYLHQKFYCKICKIGFKGLDELLNHDRTVHKLNSQQKYVISKKIQIDKNIIEPTDESNTSELAIVNVTTDPTAFDTPDDSVLYSLLTTDDVAIVNDKDSPQLQATVSANKSIAVSSNVDNVNQQTLLMSLVYDDDGNYQLIPNNSQFEITKCDTTFQGSKVVSNDMPVINNNNEIIDIASEQFIVESPNIEIAPKDTTTVKEFEIVSYETTVAEVEEPSVVVDESEENEKLINSERDTVITTATEPIESKAKEVKQSDKDDECNAVTIDSSSDQDSEVMFDKICLRTENELETKTDDVTAEETKKVKADDEIQYVGSSPSKSASKPRLRVKNFSELLAVKNYICQRCNAAFDNETSLTEHLTAHLNNLIGIGTTPTMRAALMLPSTAVDTNTTAGQPSQQPATSALTHLAGKRMMPQIPTRSHGPDARKATALNRVPGGDGYVEQNQLSASLPYSYPPVYNTQYSKQLQQHSLLNASSNVHNMTNLPMGMVPLSQMNPGQLPNNSLAETGSIDASGNVKERQRTYNCRVCRFVTTDRQYIVRHVRNHLSTNQDQLHMNLTQSNNNPQLQNAAAAAASASMAHQYHQSVNTANTSTQLQQIYNCTNNFQNIDTNARNELNNRYLAQQLTGYFCIQCRMYFDSEEYLKSHMSQYHHTYCKNCRQRFKSYDDLADHICCPPNPWT